MEPGRKEKAPEQDEVSGPAVRVREAAEDKVAAKARAKVAAADKAPGKDVDKAVEKAKAADKAAAKAAEETDNDASLKPTRARSKIMPGGDGTGPGGMGPMTGRAAGFCAGYAVPGYMNPVAGGGFGGGGFRGGFRGGGRGGWGRRNGFYATGLTGWQRAAGWPAQGMPAPTAAPYPYAPGAAPAMTKDQQLEFLKAQAEAMNQQVQQIQEQIQQLEQEG